MSLLKCIQVATLGVFLTMFSWASLVSAAEIKARNYNNLPVIIIKVDDLKNYKLDRHLHEEANWDRFVNFISTNNLKANIGAIGEFFSKDTGLYTDFYTDLKRDIIGTGAIELFNHNMCYCPEMFTSETSYSNQYASLDETQRMIKRSMGITMIAFGSGGNKKSPATAQVMNNHPDMKVWFFGDYDYDKSKILNLERTGGLTNIDATPSPAEFVNEFKKNINKAHVVLQGHPGRWTDSQFNNFRKAMLALLASYPKVKAMTVSEYYRYSGGSGDVPTETEQSPPQPPKNINVETTAP